MTFAQLNALKLALLTNSLKLVPSLGFQGALSVAAVSQTTHMASVDTSGVSSLNRESPSFSENKKLNEKNAFDVFPHSNFSSSLPVGLFDPHLGPIMALLEFLFIQIDNSLIESSIANISALNNSDSLLETRNLAFDANASLPSDSLLLKLCADRINLLAPYKQHLPEAYVVMTSSPRRAFRALSWLNHTVDTLFQLAIKDGDSLKKHHASFSYYTQRTALASVLTSSDLLLVQDSSVNCRDTKNYIQDRLQNLNSLEYQFLQIGKSGAFYGGLLRNYFK